MASTEVSVEYRMRAWYTTLSCVLLIPPVFLVILPLLLCLGFASIADVPEDPRTITAALIVFLVYIFMLSFLYGMFSAYNYTQ